MNHRTTLAATCLLLAWHAHAAPLHDAAATGAPWEITQLINAGADPNVRDAAGHTPLHHAAIRFEKTLVITALLSAGADPNARAQDGSTPLHYATGTFRNFAANALIEAGADPMARNRDGDTPLHYFAAGWHPSDQAGQIGLAMYAAAAIATGSPASPTAMLTGLVAIASGRHNKRKMVWTVEYLVNAGADLSARNNAGETPAELATRLGHLRLAYELQLSTIPSRALVDASRDGDVAGVKTALEQGADLEAQIPGSAGNRALHEASRRPHADVVATLLDAGADPNATNARGDTPLHVVTNLIVGARDPATMDQRAKVVELLLDAGADRTMVSGDNRTAKQYATAYRSDRLLELLNTYALTIDAATVRALHEAVTNRNSAAIKTLAANGADLDQPAPDGATALCRALIEDSGGVILALLEAGADVNARNLDWQTPLHCLAARKHRYPRDLVQTLHRAGARLDLTDKTGASVVHAAAANNNHAMMEYLLTNWAKSNATNADGYTAWHIAAARDAVPTLAKLLKYRKDELHIRGPVGETPLHSAMKAGAGHAMRTLIVGGADTNARDNDGKTPADWAAAAGH